jgi:hydroxymethylpyrimidine/phosphomethylpyrimidine kinase
MDEIPIVLCVGGHDPTGGAGIQADIETVTALGGRALTLVTALTAQDSRNVQAVWPTAGAAFSVQLDTLLSDISPTAVKIGLIGSADLVDVLAERLTGFAGPVVVDPVLAAGGGFQLAHDDLLAAIRERLLPYATLITPNRAEARRLARLEDPDASASALLDAGAGAVLLTGADEAADDRVVNRLFTPAVAPQTFEWPRLDGVFHGSGCTLASACAIQLARDQPLHDAVAAAQAFTHRALRCAVRPGRGQALPHRAP